MSDWLAEQVFQTDNIRRLEDSYSLTSVLRHNALFRGFGGAFRTSCNYICAVWGRSQASPRRL
jgi:hypothetical protein